LYGKRYSAITANPDATTAGPEGQHRIAFIRTCRLCHCELNIIFIVPQSMPSTFIITTTNE